MPKINFKEFEVHPEGSYRAHVTAIEEDELQYGACLKIHLTTDEGTQECIANLSYTPKSKLTQLSKAVFGEAPAHLDTDDLLGKYVGIVVAHETKGEVTYSKVASFHRLKKTDAAKKEDPFE